MNGQDEIRQDRPGEVIVGVGSQTPEVIDLFSRVIKRQNKNPDQTKGYVQLIH